MTRLPSEQDVDPENQTPDDEDIDIKIVDNQPLQYAPTEEATRPRAVLIGYKKDSDNPGFGTILVVFRDSEDRLYEYRNVPQDMWDAGDGVGGLKNATSTGKFLQADLDAWPDKGFAGAYGGTSYQKITAVRMKKFGSRYSEVKGTLRKPSEFRKSTGRRRGVL